MKKLYVVGDGDKAAVDLTELRGFGGSVYAHGLLEELAGYDIVGQLVTDKYEQKDLIEDVIAVLPDGKEMPATVFIWIATMMHPYDDWRTGEQYDIIDGTRLLGLLVAKEDAEAMEYARKKYDEKPWHI